MFSILISKTITDLPPEKYNVIKAFTNFCVEELGIEQDFKLFLVDTTSDGDIPDMSLACFDITTNNIFVRANGRIAMDVNRSIAHELDHLKQKQEDRINQETYTDIGTGNVNDIEDEANYIAGQLCKKFVKAFDCKWVYQF